MGSQGGRLSFELCAMSSVLTILVTQIRKEPPTQLFLIEQNFTRLSIPVHIILVQPSYTESSSASQAELELNEQSTCL